MLAVQSPREWNRFCEKVLRRPELERDPRFATNSARVQHRSAMDGIVQEALGKLPMSEIVSLLDEAQMAYGRMNSVQEFVDHPQLAARGRWREVDSPVGPLKALVPPVTMEGVEPRMDAIPELGQHTDAILRELGFDSATIAAWRQAKMI